MLHPEYPLNGGPHEERWVSIHDLGGRTRRLWRQRLIGDQDGRSGLVGPTSLSFQPAATLDREFSNAPC
jgi:hypothetical protein